MLRPNPVHSLVSLTLLVSADSPRSPTGTDVFAIIVSVSPTQHTPS